jgi:hypothetical protein
MFPNLFFCQFEHCTAMRCGGTLFESFFKKDVARQLRAVALASPTSFQASADDFKKLIHRLGVQGARLLFGIDRVLADVVRDDFGHETGHGPPRSRD